MQTALPGLAHPYSWQQQQAAFSETGDSQRLTEFDPASYGGVVRHIDYKDGDDANDGASPGSAWKHHPWDYYAIGAGVASRAIG